MDQDAVRCLDDCGLVAGHDGVCGGYEHGVVDDVRNALSDPGARLGPTRTVGQPEGEVGGMEARMLLGENLAERASEPGCYLPVRFGLSVDLPRLYAPRDHRAHVEIAVGGSEDDPRGFEAATFGQQSEHAALSNQSGAGCLGASEPGQLLPWQLDQPAIVSRLRHQLL